MTEKYIFMGRRKFWWFLISGLIMVPGIVSLLIWKLPLGIDFKGGAQFELSFEKPATEDALRTELSGISDVKGVIVTKSGTSSYLIKTLPISNDKYQEVVTDLGKNYGKVTEIQYQSVQPSVSNDLTRKAIIAVILASLLIIIYLAISFRGVSHPVTSWQFGTIAVVALIHDLLITVGVFSIVAHFTSFEVDASFITALLTVMGFSVHDTIVVFDRVRENLLVHKLDKFINFERTVDVSLSQTLNRSLATSLTVIFTLTSLVLLGGSSIRPFVSALLIGITIGTYSSIFTASPLLVVWQARRAKTVESPS